MKINLSKGLGRFSSPFMLVIFSLFTVVFKGTINCFVVRIYKVVTDKPFDIPD